MRGSILVISNNPKDIENEVSDILQNQLKLTISDNNPDILEIDVFSGKRDISIDQIREMIKFITQKPFSNKHKAVLIKNATLLSVPAQNTLLKTLEEPPNYASIILGVKNKTDLLETVVSRCQIINIKENTSIKDADTSSTTDININDIKKLNLGDRIKIAEDLSKEDKGEIIDVLNKLVLQEREELIKKHAIETTFNIKNIEKVMEDIKGTNLNTKLALEYLVLQLK